MNEPISMTKRVEALRAVLSGAQTSQAAAAQLGVSEAQFAQWLDVWTMSQEFAAQEAVHQKRLRRRSFNRAAVAATMCVAVAIGAWVTQPAWAQAVCTQTLPSPLKTFCPDSPALASEVNGNFSTVAGWLSTKTGTLGSQDIATRDVTLSGTLNFGSASRQMLNLYATQYALGVQNSTTYLRTGGGFAFYLNGAHAPNQWDSGGGTTLMTLDGSGNLNATGQLSAGSLRQRDCQWTYSGKDELQDNQVHLMVCGAGRYMAGWQCYAGTYLDGRCYAYCCLP
jgi:transposase-like protein